MSSRQLGTDPAFLPKVSLVFHCTQEIILPTFCPMPSGSGEEAFHTLDVRRYLLKYLEVTESQSSSLFVLMEGSPKGDKASKSTLGRWLKQAIKEAYLSLGLEPPEGILPHSTQAVAATWAERARASPEQICKAATLSSFSTFIKALQVGSMVSLRPVLLAERFYKQWSHAEVSSRLSPPRCCPERRRE